MKEVEVLNTSLKGVSLAAVATVAPVTELRGVIRRRFLLGSDILKPVNDQFQGRG